EAGRIRLGLLPRLRLPRVRRGLRPRALDAQPHARVEDRGGQPRRLHRVRHLGDRVVLGAVVGRRPRPGGLELVHGARRALLPRRSDPAATRIRHHRDDGVRRSRAVRSLVMTEATVEAGPVAPEPVSKRRRVVRIVSWIVGLVLLLVVLNLLGVNVRDWLKDLWDSVKEISVFYIVLGCIFQCLQTVLTALGWYGILRYAYPGGVTFMPVLAAYATGVA